MDIHVLHKQGLGVRAIARKLGLSKNTVKRYLCQPQRLPQYSERAPRASKLDPYKDYIAQRISAAAPYWIPAAVLYREIKARGYEGSESPVREYVSKLKPRAAQEPLQRFETAPGVQLQADFTTIKRGKHTLKAFVATLGYSRASFVRFSDSEKQEDWLRGIEGALHYFGGVPQEILFDNAKCIVIERDAYGQAQHRWNPALLDQAKTYGYQPKACRPYRAKTKGKVERFNRYLKESFITPLAASLNQAGLVLNAELANAHIGPWLAQVAHQREHGTTKEKPCVRLQAEQHVLRPLPDNAAPLAVFPVGRFSQHPQALPNESFQHPLSRYDQLLEKCS